MATAAAPLPVDAASPAPRGLGWGEFLAAGGATLLLVPALLALRWGLGLDAAELAVGFVMFHAAAVINDPHFAVTYLLFYRRFRARALGGELRGAQRLRYLGAGVLAPLVLGGWAALALHQRSAPALGWLIQLMFLLVGWHYVKQGFGVLNVLALRRGHRWSDGERRALLAHAYAAWAHAWATPADAGTTVEEKGVVYLTLAHGPGLARLTLAALVVTGALAAARLWRRARRDGRGPPLAPLACFVVTLWVWTIGSSLDPLLLYCIPALHSVQYLYFVGLREGNRARAAEGPPAFGRPAPLVLGALALTSIGLGWLLLQGGPGAADELLRASPGARPWPEALGATPALAAGFTVVNLHHYFMDAVLWRREQPESRYLVSGALTPPPATPSAS